MTEEKREIYEMRPDLPGVLQGIEEYNKQFNIGGIVGRKIVADIDKTKAKDETVDQEKRLEELSRSYEITLDSVGIALERVDSKGFAFGSLEDIDEATIAKIKDFIDETGISEEDIRDPESYEYKKWEQFINGLNMNKTTRGQEMRINISDPKKFVSYLEFLRINGIMPEEKKALEELVNILEKQLIEKYDASNPDDWFLNFVSSLGKIIELYESLGIENSIGRLKELLEATKKKYLKEFLMVEKNEYLNINQKHGFGPDKWHTDMTSETYDKTWNEALETYRETLKNPNAKDLSERLRNHLFNAAETAQKEIESTPINSDYEKNFFPGFLKTLSEARKELASEK